MDNMAANAAADTSAAEEVGQEGTAAEGSVAAPAPQSTENVTETQAFARRLKEKTAESTDTFVRGLGMQNTYTGEPIVTAEQLRAYRAMQAADEQGLDPQTTAEVSSLREQLAQYERREQMETIRQNPQLSPIFDEYHDNVMELVDYSAAQGNPIDIESALRIVMSQNIDAIRARDIERARQEALAGVNGNRAASPGMLGGAPAGGATSFADMSDAEFDRVLAAAKRGEMRKS